MVINTVAASTICDQQSPKRVPSKVPIARDLGEVLIVRVATYVGRAECRINHCSRFQWLLSEARPGPPSGIPALVPNGHEDALFDGKPFIKPHRIEADPD